MKKIMLMLVMVCVLAGIVSAFNCGDNVSYEGQDYNTVQIGTQCWFKENLNVGTKLASVATEPNTGDSTIEKWCYDNSDANCNSDGGLYSWDEAMSVGTGSQGICPSGWHIPTHDEWTTLELEVCTSETCATDFPYDTTTALWRGTDEGTKLKSGGTSGFEALLAGFRWQVDGSFDNRGTYAYLWSSTESDGYARDRHLHLVTATVCRYTYYKTYGLSVRCLKDTTTTPTHTNFTSTQTTNFSAVDVTNVTNLTLAIDNKGKIAFPSNHSINAENADYDTNVKIEDAMIYVDSAALDSSFNDSATLTFYNVDCNKPYVFYSETTSTFASILSENQRCLEPLCTNIQCEGSTLTVDVAHFTGYAAGTDANLTIEAEAGIKYPSDSINFYAWYINSTDGTPISGECNISFDDAWGTWFEMDYNGSEYNYTKSSGFAAAGTHEYNVTCSSANFVTLEANDTKIVSPTDIPEFSTITLGLGLITVLGGLFVIRKKK